jgi:hypothetical protein
MVHALHEAILDRIRRGIDQLVDNRFAIEQSRDAWFFRGPEVLPATSERVLTSSEQLVKVFDELRASSFTIEDDCVVVVGLGHRQNHINIATTRRDRETIDKRIVRGVVRTQQELTLGAAASDEVELLSEYLPWHRHTDAHSKSQAAN